VVALWFGLFYSPLRSGKTCKSDTPSAFFLGVAPSGQHARPRPKWQGSEPHILVTWMVLQQQLLSLKLLLFGFICCGHYRDSRSFEEAS
jgi:hypothetical protein